MVLLDRLKLFINPPNIKLFEDNQNLLRKSLDHVTKKNQFLSQKYTKTDSYKYNIILSTIYDKSKQTKEDIVREVQDCKETYIFNALMNVLVEDALGASAVTKDIVNITYSDNDKLNVILKDLQSNIDIDGIVKNISEDLIANGEYILRTEFSDKRGLIDVIDDVNQSEVIALYESNIPKKFLVRKKQITEERDMKEFIHFCIGSRKIRIKLDEKNLEEYVRIGRPLFYGTYDLLKSLMLMTALYPASFIQKMNGTSIVSIQIPETTTPQEAFEVCRKYEELLNNAISINTSNGEVNISDVLNAAGRFKVIPTYTEKGTMQKADPRYEEMTDITVLKDIRETICSTLGIPYGFVFGGDSASKTDSLKSYARYIRRLASIQDAVSNGLKMIAYIHLKSLGYNPIISKIEARFTNQLVSIDELDKIEFTDTLISTLANLADSVAKISNRLGTEIDGEKLKIFLNSILKIVNLDEIFLNIPSKINTKDDN